MFAALLTTFAFACSGVSAGRASNHIGAMQAVFGRSVFALCFLALYAFTLGQGLQGPGALTFIASGAIGFGLGDLALFETYTRLGPRLGILLSQCLCAPIASLIEWLWLDTKLTTPQILLVVVILLGVGISLAPTEHHKIPRPIFIIGLFSGIIAAAGQGWGAVLSRHAFQLNQDAHIYISASSATFQRMLGGAVLIFLVFGVYLFNRQRRNLVRPSRNDLGWLLAHTCCGPIIGVSCFQWALSSTPSGIVLAIVATTPIAIMPMTHWLEGDKLTARNLIGAIIAVGGVIGLIFI